MNPQLRRKLLLSLLLLVPSAGAYVVHWAIFHLADELDHRQDLASFSDADRQHLSQDIRRACDLLIRGWLQYVRHLKSDYPFLFSLAVRTNPFDPTARVELA